MSFKIGDFVIFRKPKNSIHPTLRAIHVKPARHGETYHYFVDKLWKVVNVFDNTIEIETRRGKRHCLSIDSPQLRKVGLLDRLSFRNRFF